MHTRTTLLVTLVSLLCASMSFAAPTKLSQQGRLLDGDGAPLSGGHGLAFTLHDAETDGNEVWREERVVQFEEGYYSIVLGTVTPLDDLLFAGGTVWMQLSVDGAVLSPRQEVVSVPYALRSAVAEAVEGGTVDADEVAIGGSVVIDSSGNWLGTPTDWSELTGVPADLSDGDADSDTLLGLPCADGFVAKYSAALGAWDCAEDNDSLATLVCLPGDIPVLGPGPGGWICGTDQDTDTQLTETQVDAFVANNNYAVGAHTTDTDTQLTETQVDAFVDNNGYAIGAHTTNTDLLAGTSCNPGQVLVYSSSSPQWECGEDTDTNLTQTELQTLIEVMTLNLQASTSIGGSPALTAASTLDPTQLDASSASSGEVLTYDNGSVGWAGSGGNDCQVLETLSGRPTRLRFQCGSSSFIVEASSTLTAIALPVSNGPTYPGHQCAIDTGGEVHCWGSNNEGQATAPSGTFLSVAIGNNVSCGIRTNGTVECWGEGGSGQVSSVPTGSFTNLAAAQWYSVCALDSSGSIHCWGNDAYGVVTNTPSGSFTQLAAGYAHYCALASSGNLQCWGRDNYQQVSSTPSGTFTELTLGNFHGCGLNTAGALQCWGRDNSGQVGDTPSGTFTAVSAGREWTCAVDSSASLQCWGGDGAGQVSNAPSGTFSGIFASRNDSNCAIASDGRVHCWGNEGGFRGTPTSGSFTDIYGNSLGYCGMLGSGEVICWGSVPDTTVP